MKTSYQTYVAVKIMAEIHKDQKRKEGIPYVTHPIAVMLEMDTEEEKQVAALHDVFEDSSVYRFADLFVMGFSTTVVDALILLTRDKSETYHNYIKKLSLNDIATKVKIADLEHNLSTLTKEMDASGSLRKKYLKALDFLREEKENEN